MLVLTRKPDQRIIIGTDIEITVLEIRGEQVRLGIRAPRSVAVHRKEVYDQINSEEKGLHDPGVVSDTAPPDNPIDRAAASLLER